ncbi:protein-disulfide reductase DsbD family protein [Roseibacterium sp. SDUM158016]|uniref:protein-disulfide reductase DsbD domain-containing protein n=1 Tax=Roseicyclus sediminis TaxID=2980997 RepID=UPI0021CF738E|nr:protein-disulfide reductase DsbD domain-containing protein [Roseibacterium sp. SDUM158016]MCU4651350.1 protein-disulfide reductase DsbD family protein [Roseibacterium sp. SDUM158016]
MSKTLSHIGFAALAATALALSPLPASAQFEGRSADSVVQISFLEGWRMENGHHMAGIRISLAPGWKTYWRAPGEGGVPTVLRLRSAEGITGMAIHWPRPEVFFTNGMRSIGYRDDVVLPVEFVVDDDGTHRLEGRVEMGVCLDVCMPVTLDISGDLLPDTGRDHEIGLALSDRPMTAVEAGAGDARCEVEPISDGLRVTVTAQVPSTGNDETLVLEHRDPEIWVSEAATRRDGGTITAVADIVPPDHGPFALDRSDLRITVIGTAMAVELDRCRG